MLNYGVLLKDIKSRVRQAQKRAVFSANREMLALYWDTGRMLDEQEEVEGRRSNVLKRLSDDLKNELSETIGFSEKNLKCMMQFFREYPQLFENGFPEAAQLDSFDGSVSSLVLRLPWMHNILLFEMVEDVKVRRWYMKQALSEGWNLKVLQIMIKSLVHERQDRTPDSFDALLPVSQSDLANEALNDPYILDFLTLEKSLHERTFELGLIRCLERYMMELGKGFAFVGRRYQVDAGEESFYLDLLFYHLRLRCYIVIDLKSGPYKPDYGGKMNFYCSAVDDRLRNETDCPTIGLLLCRDKARILAEYALREANESIGVSEYELTRTLPNALKYALPDIESLENQLNAYIREANG